MVRVDGIVVIPIQISGPSGAVLSQRIAFVIVAEELYPQKIPPPSSPAEFPEIVVFVKIDEEP